MEMNSFVLHITIFVTLFELVATTKSVTFTKSKETLVKSIKLYIAIVLFILAGCDNPGGISDKDCQAYKILGAPKILYSCDEGRKTLSADPNILSECLKINDFSKEGVEKQLACAKRAERKVEPIVEVGYVAGIGSEATYNRLVSDEQKKCQGKFKILEGKEQ
jgi:hypothetical protein